jgi:predicted transcriptional regulator
MTIADLITLLDGELLCGEDRVGQELEDYAASDLLSDILAFEKDNYALMTGLTNGQILRTAEITNARCVVILRGKHPQQEAVVWAKRSGIPLILSHCSMFEACRRLGVALETQKDGGAERASSPSGS